MQVSKWGNSLAVRLPAKLVQELGLKEGDEIEIRPAADRALEVAKAPDRLEALKALRKFRGMMPEGYKFDRDEANARGADDTD